MLHYYYPGWVGVEIIRIKALLSSTGLELELSLAKIGLWRFRGAFGLLFECFVGVSLVFPG